MSKPSNGVRCRWVTDDPLYIAYHDAQWGVPEHDEALLFEMLILEGAQAGLSWITILKKREHFRRAYAGFDAKKIARYGPREVKRLLQDSSIIRNRLKIESAITNARATLTLWKDGQTLDSLLWQFVQGQPRTGHHASWKDVPSRTAESDEMSKELRRRGFKFVGSTICYAFMQAVGMVNDHTTDCFRYRELSQA